MYIQKNASGCALMIHIKEILEGGGVGSTCKGEPVSPLDRSCRGRSCLIQQPFWTQESAGSSQLPGGGLDGKRRLLLVNVGS